jgi:anti-sigma-K factor RskA
MNVFQREGMSFVSWMRFRERERASIWVSLAFWRDERARVTVNEARVNRIWEFENRFESRFIFESIRFENQFLLWIAFSNNRFVSLGWIEFEKKKKFGMNRFNLEKKSKVGFSMDPIWVQSKKSKSSFQNRIMCYVFLGENLLFYFLVWYNENGFINILFNLK